MSLDVIKQYLVGIGFNVDGASLNQAKQQMNNAEATVKSFAKNNNKSMDSMNSSFGDLAKISQTSIGTLTKLFPGMKGPLTEIIGQVNTVKQTFKEFSSISKDSTNAANDSVNKFQSSTSKSAGSAVKSLSNLGEKSSEANSAIKSFAAEGGEAIGSFSVSSLAALGPIAAAIVAIVIAGKKLSDYLGGLAKNDLEYDKLARQMWTTKENAKEISMALNTMGVSMKDLWLSPELLQQFNQLRKDASEMKLPQEYTDNLKVIRELGYEFQRLKLVGSFVFQWIGNYILKYVSGPLVDTKDEIHSFTDGLIRAAPTIGKAIGTVIGVIVRLFVELGNIIGFILGLIGKLVGFIHLADNIPGPLKNIIKIIGLVALAMMLGPVAVIGILILAIDDISTALRGGKSVIGSVFGFFKDRIDSVLGPIKAVGQFINTYIIKPIEFVVNKIQYAIDEIKKAAKEVKDLPGSIANGVKSVPGNIAQNAKNTLGNIGNKVKDFGSMFNGQNTTPSYIAKTSTNKNSSTVSNSNNKTNNNFNIYSNDPTSVAKTVNNKINNTGINIRNAQGAY